MVNPTIENPIIGDKVTFIRTARETGGALTLVEVELAPKGGNDLHLHRHFAEVFTCKRGQLSVEVDGAVLHLLPGESATAPVGSLHRFYNETNRPVLFDVQLTPGSEGFEQTLCIGYGLARDGRCYRSGIPRNIYHLALLLTLSDTRLPGPARLLEPMLERLSRRARRRGIEQALLEQYWEGRSRVDTTVPSYG